MTSLVQLAIVILVGVCDIGTSLPAQSVVGYSVNSLITHEAEGRALPPCELTVTGPWKDYVNISITPNPPRRDRFVNLVADVTAKDNVLAVSIRYEVSMNGRGIVFKKEKLLCDIQYHSYICPIEKGETRHGEKQFNPGYMPKATYSAYMDFLDQDDEIMLKYSFTNCTLF